MYDNILHGGSTMDNATGWWYALFFTLCVLCTWYASKNVFTVGAVIFGLALLTVLHGEIRADIVKNRSEK